MQGITNAVTSSENSELYYTKNETDVLLNAKADTATTLTGYGISDAYTKTEVNTALAGKASTSLDNLSANGQMIVDSQNGTISNCILEIPQNLKLEFSNGALTVKAGSVLVNSGEPYSTVTLTSDATLALSPQQNTDYMVFMYANSSFAARRISDQICSGNTDTLFGTPYHVWFDTSNKITKSYGSNTSPEAYTQFRYPICVLKTNSSGNAWEGFAKDSNGNDLIFNGAGFIGHHAFVYPGVKGYSPEGWTGVHHLNSNVYVNSSLKIIELSQGQAVTGYNRILGFNNLDSQQKCSFYNEYNTRADAPLNDSWKFCYIRDENQILFSSNGTNIIKWHDSPFIEYNVNTNNVVTDFTIRQPVRTATVEMLENTLGDIETLLAAI